MKKGRPLKNIDWNIFDQLCSIQCTLVEVSEWFNCSEDTIERAVKREKKMTFAEYYKKKSAKGKRSLRREMFDIALSGKKGNIPILIWLSKQHLGMKDKEPDIKANENKGTNGTQIVKIQWADENVDTTIEDEAENTASNSD